MEIGTAGKYKPQARVLKALAHPTRLFFLGELVKRPVCVCRLAAAAGIDVSTASRHLSMLKNAGLLADEKRGLEVHYRIRSPHVARILGCVETTVKAIAEEELSLVR